MRAFLKKLTSFQIINIILDTFLQLWKRKKVDFINRLCSYDIAWFFSFDFMTNVIVGEGEHPTISVVKDGDFGCPKETLGNNDAPKCLLAAKQFNKFDEIRIRKQPNIRGTSSITNNMSFSKVNLKLSSRTGKKKGRTIYFLLKYEINNPDLTKDHILDTSIHTCHWKLLTNKSIIVFR